MDGYLLEQGSFKRSPQYNKVPGLAGIKAIAAEGFHSLALKSDGTIWEWGDNYNAYKEVTPEYNPITTPKQVEGGDGFPASFTMIATEYYRSMAIGSDGTIWYWGLHNQDSQYKNHPEKVVFTTNP
jgi:alpha-tubulin suppressor-like RCC1 family protein